MITIKKIHYSRSTGCLTPCQYLGYIYILDRFSREVISKDLYKFGNMIAVTESPELWNMLYDEFDVIAQATTFDKLFKLLYLRYRYEPCGLPHVEPVVYIHAPVSGSPEADCLGQTGLVRRDGQWFTSRFNLPVRAYIMGLSIHTFNKQASDKDVINARIEAYN